MLGSIERTPVGNSVGADVDEAKVGTIVDGELEGMPAKAPFPDITPLVGVSDGDGEGAGESVGVPLGEDRVQLGVSDGDGEG